MVSLVSLEEKPTEVNLGELLSWTWMQNFSPSGIIGTAQKGHSQYHKSIKIQKGSTVSLTWCWQPVWFSASTFLTRNSNMISEVSSTEEGQRGDTAQLSMAERSWLSSPDPWRIQLWLNLGILTENRPAINGDWFKKSWCSKTVKLRAEWNRNNKVQRIKETKRWFLKGKKVDRYLAKQKDPN